MRVIDQNTITDAALQQMANTPNPRLKQIMESLVRHLHDFAREVDLTPEEWLEGIKFLTAVGQKCTPYRQEFVLLSDTLGLSSLVNKLHDRRATQASTDSSLLGPFYRQDSPVKKPGESIVSHPNVPEVILFGKVTDAAGRPIANASVEIWQPDETGNYDLQKHDPSVMDLRGRYYTDADGRYIARSITPFGYKVPMDGPVGDMLRAQNRPGWRPAHIHFLVSAPGYREIVTALYVAGDEHIEQDTVFGVTQDLVVGVRNDDPECPVPNMPSLRFDFRMAAVAAAAASGRVGADPSQIVKR
jgi:hydroxyquinol 1,2-dioxygenase